jgi:hypothetical protein
MKCRWNRTMLNLCGIVAAILKMVTANNLWQKLWISFFFFLHQNQNIFFSNICLEKNPLQVKWSFPNWFPTLKNFYRTMLNFCGIVAAILKMVIGRNFSMSGHYYLPTYQILMISDNVVFFVAQFFPEFDVIWQKLWISFFFFLHQNQNIFFSNICLEKNPLQMVGPLSTHI